jgi:hypothetical protein
LPTYFDDLGWNSGRLFREDFGYHDRIVVDAVDNPALVTDVSHAQLMTVAAHTRHWARLRHRQTLSFLKTPQREPCLQTRRPAERGRLDLAVQPYEWSVRSVRPIVDRRHSVCPF